MARSDSNYLTSKELGFASRLIEFLNAEKHKDYALSADITLWDSNGENAGRITVGETGEYVLWPGVTDERV